MRRPASASRLRRVRRLIAAGPAASAILALAVNPSLAASASGTLSVQIAAPVGPANTMTVSDASGSGETDYPLQFGRPFLDGAIPSGQLPQVLVNGTPVPTQADVKKSWPDGSVMYAVVAAVIPSIPANGSVTLGFEPSTADSNTPLTAAQMEGSNYNFDAAMQLAKPTSAVLTSAAETGNTLAQWQAITNGGFTITLNGTVEHVTGINMSSLASNWSNFASLLTANFPAGLTYSSVAGSGVTVLATSASGPSATLSYGSAPTDGSQDISAMLGILQSQGATLSSPGSSVTGSADARTMLKNGDYKLWTSGPVAQTIILGDDTPTAKYDIGLGDGFTPFRPHFEATFWPATNQVFVRAIGENDKTTQLEDIGPYNLTITGGASSPATEDTTTGFTQPAMTVWTDKFWLGGTPNAQVNVNYNLAYLESTRFVPNYDTSVTIPAATIASDYASWWNNGNNAPITGSGGWQPGMETTGARPDIGPEPSWDAAWLYTGDWRMAQAALGNADLAGAWPVNTRETDPDMRLNRADAIPASGQTGSGYGYPISTTDRNWLGPSTGGEADFLYYNSDYSTPPNKLGVVGTITINESAGQDANGWVFDAPHEPSPFFVPYLLTGDPFYLREMENWEAYDATQNDGGEGTYNGVGSQFRGPTGSEGGADAEERGDAWTIRSRAETAFIVPDSDPFKTYVTTLLNEDLARWEGAFGITGTPYTGTTEEMWAAKYGNPEGGPVGSASPIGQWSADNSTPTIEGLIGAAETDSNVGAFNDPWMEHYIGYALGRAYELGFAAQGLLNFVGEYETGLIDTSGYPDLLGNYEEPSTTSAGAWLASWPAYIATYETPFLTGNGYTGGAAQGSVPQQFGSVSGGEGELYNQGYDAYAWAAMAGLVNAGVSGAAQAEAWLNTNVYQPILNSGSWAADPSWDIVPRTDTHTLPAVATAVVAPDPNPNAQ
jgi:hypothetical protein